jgi:hypothetical protein
VINPESQKILEARRKRRLATIWVLAATVVVGNLGGWLGFSTPAIPRPGDHMASSEHGTVCGASCEIGPK